MRYFLLVLSIFGFVGCSQFTFNATMCNEIASDPHANMPKECRPYLDEEAQKAFDNTLENQKTNDDEVIKFQKSQDE